MDAICKVDAWRSRWRAVSEMQFGDQREPRRAGRRSSLGQRVGALLERQRESLV